jgi:filamentous hemagglutinin family protein
MQDALREIRRALLDADVNFKGDRKNFLPKATDNSLSEVFGRLNGEGKNICPVNPKGIICGEDARINVGSIYTSTRNINKTYLRAFESSSVLIGKITASQLCQADCPGGNQRWLEVKQQRKGGHFFGTRGKSGRIDSQ